jgi:crotonobetainyl-CoA:carnitine CoA-transferase CaiB-like acyl-CoA transferase
MAGALHGLRVLDLTRLLPGPYCTLLLGDLGADVVKVEEPPFGDPVRAVPPAVGEDGAVHAALNRNKRSVVVDLKTEEGAEVVGRLAARADVLVESFRPGVLEGRGLSAASLLALNPRLVYCSLTGYGRGGPMAERAGHDLNYLGLAGFLDARPDGPGPAVPVGQAADVAGALLAVAGVLAALFARERTGRGQAVDASLLDGALALVTVPLSRALAGGGAMDELQGEHACYRAYRCADGRWLSVGAIEPKFYARLCRAVGLPEEDRRQWPSSPEKRRESVARFAAAFAARERDDWVRELAGADACVAPVLDLSELPAHPELSRRLVEQPGRGAPVRTLAAPLRLSDTPPSVRRLAPALGEHTLEVLGEAGYTPAQIASMRAAGAVG